jgi:hypothetical protein
VNLPPACAHVPSKERIRKKCYFQKANTERLRNRYRTWDSGLRLMKTLAIDTLKTGHILQNS